MSETSERSSHKREMRNGEDSNIYYEMEKFQMSVRIEFTFGKVLSVAEVKINAC